MNKIFWAFNFPLLTIVPYRNKTFTLSTIHITKSHSVHNPNQCYPNFAVYPPIPAKANALAWLETKTLSLLTPLSSLSFFWSPNFLTIDHNLMMLSANKKLKSIIVKTSSLSKFLYMSGTSPAASPNVRLPLTCLH